MLVGLVVALPPMALFMFSVVNPNSSEIAAGLCFAAGLVRLMRDPRSTVAWSAVVIGGVVLAVARSLGPFWLAFGLLVLLADIGARGAARLPKRTSIAAAAALTAAALACAWWEATRQPHLPITAHDTLHNLPTALNEWVMLLRQSVGVFGWNDTRMLALVYILGWLIAGGLGVGALIVASPRERAILAGAAVALLLAAVVISAAVLHKEGFAMQARYMLPPAALLPIYAAEILRRHPERMPKPSRHLLFIIVPVAAAMQITAWLTNARRYAVGSNGPINFFGHSLWRPLGGWVPWILLLAAGAALLTAAATLARDQHGADVRPQSNREPNRLSIETMETPGRR